MAAYNKATITGYLNAADTAATNAARGKAFEDLACYLFSCVPGIAVTARNVMNTFATRRSTSPAATTRTRRVCGCLMRSSS
jgi:hypothetical protein